MRDEDEADLDSEVSVIYDRQEFGAGAPCGVSRGENHRMRTAGELVSNWLGGRISAVRYQTGLLTGIRESGAPIGRLARRIEPGSRAMFDDRTFRPEFPSSGLGTNLCVSVPTFAPNNLDSIPRPACLYLAPDPYGSSLVYETSVPTSFEPTRSKSEIKWALWPRWMERCSPGGSPDWARADACLKWKGGQGPHGWFWDVGSGFYYRFLLHAIVTMHGFRTYVSNIYQFPADCGMSASLLDEWFSTKNGWIKNRASSLPEADSWLSLDEVGALAGKSGLSGAMAWAYNGKMRLNESQFVLNAAVADFYLWWAHRLYSYALDGDGGWLHMAMARWCADLAMAEILFTASVMIHEWGHLMGSSSHCSNTWGTKQNCCQDLSEAIFRTRVSAELGLPNAQVGESYNVWRRADGVLLRAGGEVVVVDLPGSDRCEPDSGRLAKGSVGFYLEPSSTCKIAREIPSKCASIRSTSDTQDYRAVTW